ncbi:SET domain-containing protein [Marasmius fiardii PR-910]|nr:SET domain-containing protein [Marasmius fiardii PR-910]
MSHPSPTRKRRPSSILQPQRPPKKSTPKRRKSDSNNDTSRRRQRPFATPISDTHQIPSIFSSSSSDVCIQKISFAVGSPCVALLEPDSAASIPNTYSNTRPCSNTYQVSLCNSNTDRRSAGYGILATRNIPRGGVILVERPVLVVSSTTFAAGDNVDQLLDSNVRTAVFNLTDAHTTKSTESTLEGILKTNGLKVEIGSKKCIGLFLDMSRVNHSCGPNAMWRWDPFSFSVVLEAVRPISSGSEITIPYIDCLQPRSERRRQLKVLYGFDCFCQHCDVHWSASKVSAQSDVNRQELREFGSGSSHDGVPSFDAWYSDKTSSDDGLIKLHLWALQTRAQEGVELFAYKKHIDVIAMCYGALEDVENFRCWTERAKNASLEVKSESEMAVLEKWIEDPRRFPVWGWRKRALKVCL